MSGDCLETGTDYVDITGEIPVIDRIAGLADKPGGSVTPSTGPARKMILAAQRDCLEYVADAE